MGVTGRERETRKGREMEERGYSPKVKFLATPLHERRQRTRFTSDLDTQFRKSWIRP